LILVGFGSRLTFVFLSFLISPRKKIIVYPDGKVCISILHPPGENKYNEFESATERWRPIIGVESILVSVVSMLSSPNINSPANIDASKQFRDDLKQFKRQVRRTVQRSMEE